MIRARCLSGATLLGLALLVTSGCRSSAPSASAADAGTTTSSAAVATVAPAPAAPSSGELTVGAVAPNIVANAHDGSDVDLGKLAGKAVVLYFYPKDETRGCNIEADSFRDAAPQLAKAGAVVVGVSVDSLESHRAFAKAHELPFALLSDADGAIGRAYGVPMRGEMLSRQSFLIGRDGKIARIYRTVDVNTHAAEVLADIGTLPAGEGAR